MKAETIVMLSIIGFAICIVMITLLAVLLAKAEKKLAKYNDSCFIKEKEVINNEIK